MIHDRFAIWWHQPGVGCGFIEEGDDYDTVLFGTREEAEAAAAKLRSMWERGYGPTYSVVQYVGDE